MELLQEKSNPKMCDVVFNGGLLNLMCSLIKKLYNITRESNHTLIPVIRWP